MGKKGNINSDHEISKFQRFQWFLPGFVVVSAYFLIPLFLAVRNQDFFYFVLPFSLLLPLPLSLAVALLMSRILKLRLIGWGSITAFALWFLLYGIWWFAPKPWT